MDQNYGYVNPAPQNGSPLSRKMLIVIGGSIFAIILAIILMVSTGSNSTSSQAQHLILRMESLQTILSDNETTRHLKNQELSNLVASFSLTQTTDINDLKIALSSQLPEKIDEKILANETDTTTASTIEEAYLKNKLDAVYAEVLTKKIASLQALIAELYGKTKDQKLKQTLESVNENLRKTGKQIDELSISN
ncbi:hypothetical protein A3F64_00265 [Candidatus Saccharibacteria bacterium RIFCSPHIGHO2_12_FULL_42_8]|nr:MAG: hypothetical protein A3F64_00265 [Candidatus Saccharibacteria bacterium RIFCSPHIGHO2_12_FULL_42_8]